jgi:very-short-patch-repair endonuclease
LRRIPAYIDGKWRMNDVFGLAEANYGVVSRAQCLASGLTVAQTENLLRTQRLKPLLPSVYRVAGAPVTGRQRAYAATLWLGEDSAISLLTGGALLRLDGCKTRDLHASVERDNRRRSNRDVIIHRVATLPSVDRVVVDGIRCTSATRTIIDLAAELESESLEVAFESARRMGLTSPQFLAKRFADLSGRGFAGTRALRELLSHQRPGERSLQYRLEVKMARLLRASKLPVFERQFPLGKFRIDFARPELRLGVECEGFEYHGSRLQWKQDKKRTAWIEAQGWRLLFVSWDDVMIEPQQTLDRVALALQR